MNKLKIELYNINMQTKLSFNHNYKTSNNNMYLELIICLFKFIKSQICILYIFIFQIYNFLSLPFHINIMINV